MATSAFKSTTKRAPIGAPSYADDSASSGRDHRRTRSLSRFSRRASETESDFAETPAPKGKFVNTVRGSGFPEISLDDLAIEFFPLKDSLDERTSERGRSSRRFSEISPATTPTISSQRRGRSVSRQNSRAVDGKSNNNSYNASGGGMTASDVNSRRRRSISAVRCQISDAESDIDHSQNSSYHGNMKRFSSGNSQMPSLQKPKDSSHRHLGRSLSQKDLSMTHDGYSSQSSALTDDEAKETHSGKNMTEKTIRAVYAQKKMEHPTQDNVNSQFYEAMRKELRYAVDEIIKMEFEHDRVRKTSALESENCLQSDSSNDLQDVSAIRKNYTTKLEQSEKRKQDLLAEIVLEEQRGRELSKIVRELHSDPKSSTIVEKPSRSKKRGNDRNTVSKRLTEEAEKYFEDFISNVEDTDLSSFDGERSDASSTLGVTKATDSVLHYGETEIFQSPAGSNSLPVEMDGVILPWLKWETSNDGSPLPSRIKRVLPVTPESILWDGSQELIPAQDPSDHSTSSRGSWNLGLDGPSLSASEDTGSMLKVGSHHMSHFDMDRYVKLEREEDLLFERWRERHRIDSGCLLLCSNAFI